MDVLIFTSSMSILVNGIPTWEIQVEKILRQQDLLSPYIFLLVAQGLTRIMAQTTRMREFNAFTFNRDVKFDILQFVDDIILFCDDAWSNLWSIK